MIKILCCIVIFIVINVTNIYAENPFEFADNIAGYDGLTSLNIVPDNNYFLNKSKSFYYFKPIDGKFNFTFNKFENNSFLDRAYYGNCYVDGTLMNGPPPSNFWDFLFNRPSDNIDIESYVKKWSTNKSNFSVRLIAGHYEVVVIIFPFEVKERIGDYSITFNADPSLPIVQTDFDFTKSYNTLPQNIQFTTTDSGSGIGTKRYRITFDGEIASNEWTAFTNSIDVSDALYSLTGDGLYAIEVEVYDNVQNLTSETYYFRVDKTDPVLGDAVFTETLGVGAVPVTDFNTIRTEPYYVQFLNASDNISIDKYQYQLFQKSIEIWGDWTDFETGSYMKHIDENGLYQFRVTDAAGNVSVPVSEYSLTSLDVNFPEFQEISIIPIGNSYTKELLTYSSGGFNINYIFKDPGDVFYPDSGFDYDDKTSLQYRINYGDWMAILDSTHTGIHTEFSGNLEITENCIINFIATDRAGRSTISDDIVIETIDSMPPEPDFQITPLGRSYSLAGSDKTYFDSSGFTITPNFSDGTAYRSGIQYDSLQFFNPFAFPEPGWQVIPFTADQVSGQISLESITITQNGNYIFKVSDNVLNEAVIIFTLDDSSESSYYIDSTPPVLNPGNNFTIDPSGWTNLKTPNGDNTLLKITPNTGDTGSGVMNTFDFVKDLIITAISSTHKYVDENGTFGFYFYDNVGNKSVLYEVVIDSIDRINPVINSILIDGNDFIPINTPLTSADHVVITVNASDMESGIDNNSLQYSLFDSGTIYEEISNIQNSPFSSVETGILLENNKLVVLRVKDIAGNQVYTAYDVVAFDETYPVIDPSTDIAIVTLDDLPVTEIPAVEDSLKVLITAHDEQSPIDWNSGLYYFSFSEQTNAQLEQLAVSEWNAAENDITQLSITINRNGFLYVSVADAAGMRSDILEIIVDEYDEIKPVITSSFDSYYSNQISGGSISGTDPSPRSSGIDDSSWKYRYDESGTWQSFNPLNSLSIVSLFEGKVIVYLQVSDNRGNVYSNSVEARLNSSFIKDSTPPVFVKTPPFEIVYSDPFLSSVKDILSVKQMFAGTDLDDSGCGVDLSSVKFFIGAKLLLSVYDETNNQYKVTIPELDLSVYVLQNGVYEIPLKMSVSDNIGNSNFSENKYFSLDVIPPDVSLTSLKIYAENSERFDYEYLPVNSVAVQCSPSAESEDVCYQYAVITENRDALKSEFSNEYIDVDELSGLAVFSLSALEQGNNFLFVRAVDRAGNNSTVSLKRILRIDSNGLTAPLITSLSHPETSDVTAAVPFTEGKFVFTFPNTPESGVSHYEYRLRKANNIIDLALDSDPPSFLISDEVLYLSDLNDNELNEFYFLEVRGVSGSEKKGEIAFYQFRIDKTPPTSFNVFSDTHASSTVNYSDANVYLNWKEVQDKTGIAQYYFTAQQFNSSSGAILPIQDLALQELDVSSWTVLNNSTASSYLKNIEISAASSRLYFDAAVFLTEINSINTKAGTVSIALIAEDYAGNREACEVLINFDIEAPFLFLFSPSNIIFPDPNISDSVNVNWGDLISEPYADKYELVLEWIDESGIEQSYKPVLIEGLDNGIPETEYSYTGLLPDAEYTLTLSALDNAVIPNRNSTRISFKLNQPVLVSNTQPYIEIVNGFRLSGEYTPGANIYPGDAATQLFASIKIDIPDFLDVTLISNNSSIREFNLNNIALQVDMLRSGVASGPFQIIYNGFVFTAESISFDRNLGINLLNVSYDPSFIIEPFIMKFNSISIANGNTSYSVEGNADPILPDISIQTINKLSDLHTEPSWLISEIDNASFENQNLDFDESFLSTDDKALTIQSLIGPDLEPILFVDDVRVGADGEFISASCRNSVFIDLGIEEPGQRRARIRSDVTSIIGKTVLIENGQLVFTNNFQFYDNTGTGTFIPVQGLEVNSEALIVPHVQEVMDAYIHSRTV